MKRLRKVNNGQYQPTATAPTYRASSALATTPPRVSNLRVNAALAVLTAGGVAAIAADCWMSWIGFKTLPVTWHVAATLTAIVAAGQIGSGVIQSLGGDPFAGVGGSAGGDGTWSITLKGLYLLDIFSNFSGFGGTQYLSLSGFMGDPAGTLGLLLWNLVLSGLLAFGDEILFRLRDRIAIGARKNRQLQKIHTLQVAAHNAALNEYSKTAMDRARAAGQKLDVNFDWLEGDASDV